MNEWPLDGATGVDGVASSAEVLILAPASCWIGSRLTLPLLMSADPSVLIFLNGAEQMHVVATCTEGGFFKTKSIRLIECSRVPYRSRDGEFHPSCRSSRGESSTVKNILYSSQVITLEYLGAFFPLAGGLIFKRASDRSISFDACNQPHFW